MIEYLSHWMHAYLTHFGMWVGLLILLDIYKRGIPEFDKTLKLLKSALVISAAASLFSSHAQTHMIEHFIKNGVSNEKGNH